MDGLVCSVGKRDRGICDSAKQWMLAHQLGRRNLTPEQVSYLRGKQGEQEKKVVRNKDGVNQYTVVKDQNDPKPDTVAAKLAEQHKVGEATIKRDMAFARNVDTVAAAVPEAKQALLARDAKVGKQEVQKLATIAAASPQTAKHVVEAVKAAPAPKVMTQPL